MAEKHTPRAAAPAGRHAVRPASGARRAPAAREKAAATRAGVSRKRPAARRARPGKGLLNVLGGIRQKIARRPRRPINRNNLNTALWLWCFPVGLSKLWRSSCTWKRGVKIGITAAMAIVMAAIFVLPTPSRAKPGAGVQMVSGDPAVEVYGPPLPSLIVPGYTHESTGSIIVEKPNSDVHYVYAADGARCYHEYECKFAFASSQRMTVYEAYHLGFEPCGRCKPPVYTPGSQLLEPGAEPTEEPADAAATETPNDTMTASTDAAPAA